MDEKQSLSDCKNGAHEEVPEVFDHFIVRPMSPQDTPDQVRAQLDNALQDLASKIRQFPTLPADPQDPTHHLTQSKSSDCALQLPAAHCAFHGCSWTGSDDEALVLHLEDQHIQALQPSMEALQQKVGGLKSQDILLMSVYNESIAIATRKDAPVASYSIDRRCMMNYVRVLVREDTCALICFSCARRFPYVPHTKHIEIKNVKLLEKRAQDEVENSTCCGLN